MQGQRYVGLTVETLTESGLFQQVLADHLHDHPAVRVRGVDGEEHLAHGRLGKLAHQPVAGQTCGYVRPVQESDVRVVHSSTPAAQRNWPPAGTSPVDPRTTRWV